MAKHDPVTNPTKAQLRSLRSAFKKLKKKGVVLSKASPSKVKLTKSMRRKILALKPVAEGRAVVLSITKNPLATKSQAIKAHKKAGRMVIGDKLILPKKKRQKARVDKRGFPTLTTKSASGLIEQVIIPIEFNTLRQWLNDVERHTELDSLKAKNERWAFKFFGGNSHATFASLKDMVEWLNRYNAFNDDSLSPDQEEEIFENLEIVRVQQAKDLWTWNEVISPYWRHRPNRQRVRTYHRDREGRSKWQRSRQRLKERNPERYKAYQAKDAARKRRSRRKNRSTK